MSLRFLMPLRDALRALNREPGKDWQDKAVHHGVRIAAVLALALLIPALFPRETLPELSWLEEGVVAPSDVVASISFPVKKSAQQVAMDRRRAEEQVLAIVVRTPNAADTSAARAHAFFERLGAAALEVERPEDASETPDFGPIRDVVVEVGVRSASTAQLALLADSTTRSALHSQIENAYTELLGDGVIPYSDLSEIRGDHVILRSGGAEEVVERRTLPTTEDFDRLALEYVSGLPAEGLYWYQTLLMAFIEPGLSFDRIATAETRQARSGAVEVNAGSVLEGEKIVDAGSRIGPAEVVRIQAYEQALIDEGLVDPAAGFWRGLGISLFGAILLSLLGLALYFFRSEIYTDIRSFAVVYLLVFLVLAAAAVIAGAGLPPALIPIAFAALLIGALFDSLLALLTVLLIAGLLAGQPAFAGLATPLLTIAAGATAGFAIWQIHQRSQGWILIAMITGAYLTAALALLMMGEFGWVDLAQSVMWGFGNATVSTALAMAAALPMLEKLTERTTDQTLLELADLNRPLLRRLAREAPGTYAHSINVANLAESACEAIGADALLARVGTYYHDVGKLVRPQYFIENQPQGLNPHDRLTPTQSAEVLRAHVREGLSLADETRLPEVIKDFIREHHGTQKIAYFLAKAQRLSPDANLDPNDFCYPGPKPQTRETAIVMLGDAVESASRSLEDPSPERIRALIDKLVETRVKDQQLAECPITMRDLDAIRREFAHVLTGLYHHRIDYPVAPDELESESGDRPTLEPDAGDAQAAASDVGPVPTIDNQAPIGAQRDPAHSETPVLSVEQLWPTDSDSRRRDAS